MSRIQSSINKGERIIENSEDQFLKQIQKAETVIIEEILKILDTVDVSAGRIQNTDKAQEFLASLESKIFRALQKAQYPAAVKEFLKTFDQVADNIKEVHSHMNKVTIGSDQIAPIKRMEVENTIAKLTEAGIAKDFVNPIRQSLYRNILMGSTITEVQKFIIDDLKTNSNGDGRLLRYAGQVARDSISQFDGSVQANIAQDLGLNAKRYVGSIIKDSRGQCVKWVTENNGLWLIEELPAQIDWAKARGSYYEAGGKRIYTSGMIKETTVATFDIYRGGWRCRHRSIPTHKPVVIGAI